MRRGKRRGGDYWFTFGEDAHGGRNFGERKF